MSEDFKVGTRSRWGETTCGYGLDLALCDEAATTHVMWLETMACSATCDEHMRFIDENANLDYETHPFGHDCGMPGSLWHIPYEDEDEGYCFFPGPDDASLLAEEPVPMTARATPGPSEVAS